MSELSPQAQAVLDAFLNGYIAAPKSGVAFCDDRNGLAAALRAAADQVVPVTSKPNDEFCCPPVETTVWNRVTKIRKHFLAIATELKNQ